MTPAPTPQPAAPVPPAVRAARDGGGLLPRLARWASRAPGEPALAVDGPHGVRWISRADLLDEAAHRAARSPGGSTGVVAVGADDATDVVTGLLAAELGSAPALVRSPEWDGAAVASLVRDLRRMPTGSGGHRGPLLALPTSGSRAAPRAVVRTTRSWTGALHPFTRLLGVGPDRPAVVWAPGSLASTLTLWAVWHALAVGLPVISTGRWRADSPLVAARALVQLSGREGRPGREGPDCVVQSVPAVAEDVLASYGRGAGPRPSRLVVAGAAVPAALRAAARGHDVPLTTYYGAAELSFVATDATDTTDTTDTHTEGAAAVDALSEGALRPFPGVGVRLRDGEIWVRSRGTALGYLGVPGPAAWSDGWVTVHDHGRFTATGELVVVGRGDDAVQVAGTTVLCADVERALESVPGVLEVVCLPEPHPRWGERPVTVVRVDPDHDQRQPALVDRLKAEARDRLAPPARPGRYVLRTELPRTAAGKVDRSALRSLIRPAPSGSS